MILGIYGAGGLGREVYELAETINKARTDPYWENIVFISDIDSEKEIWGIPVLRYEDFVLRFSAKFTQIAIAVGEPFGREHIRKKVIASNYHLATLIHPICRISPRAIILEGCIVNFGCNISYDTMIGTNTFLQPSCGIGHGSQVGEDSVISAGVRIAGNASIGNQVYVGLHSAIREKISIGDAAIISMCSSIQRDVPNEMIAAGNPARIIQKNNDHKVFKPKM